MNDPIRRLAEEDARLQRSRDVQREHWKTQQDYNAALDFARKRDGSK